MADSCVKITHCQLLCSLDLPVGAVGLPILIHAYYSNKAIKCDHTKWL